MKGNIDIAIKTLLEDYEHAELIISGCSGDYEIALNLIKSKSYKITAVNVCSTFEDWEWHLIFYRKKGETIKAFADIWSKGC